MLVVIGVWRRHPGRIKHQQQLHGSLTPDLIECGYETSVDWERVLDGVQPDDTRSQYPERVWPWMRLAQGGGLPAGPPCAAMMAAGTHPGLRLNNTAMPSWRSIDPPW